MELRQIRHFIAIVEEKTFALAARRACISQPALSRSLRTLETSLGVRLIERGLRRSAPTAAGERFLPHARAILADCERACFAVEDVDRPAAISLSIGIATPLSCWLAYRIAAEASLEYPGTPLYLQEGTPEALEDSMRGGRLPLCVAILSSPLPEPPIVAERLVPLKSVIVGARQPDGRPPDLDPARMYRHRRWVTLDGLDDHATLHRHLIRIGVERACVSRTGTVARLRSLVLDEGYLALVPPQLLHDELRRRALEVLDAEIPQPTRAVGLLYPDSGTASGRIERVKAALRRCCLDTETPDLRGLLPASTASGIAVHS